MDEQYETALAAWRIESAKFRCACEAYRAGTIGDEEYLATRAQFEAAQKVLDAVEAANIENEDKTYEIVRFYFRGKSVVMARGKTLEEVQEWCSREDTHGDGWFDGYREE